jgi:AmmeMemoRadiSam system protein A
MKKYVIFSTFYVLFLSKGITMIGNDVGPIVGLNPEEKKYLLMLARNTIETLLAKNSFPETQPVSKKIQKKFGVFVTLHKKGHLRGCIGYVEGYKPLFEAVMDMAKSAAFNDPRFPPVKEDELKDIDIEVSVLSPLKNIENIDEIQVGEHGIIIQQGYHKGLLLPQVATEWGWDREEFLRQTCHKAGLPVNAWQESDTQIQIFSAEIFSENE